MTHDRKTALITGGAGFIGRRLADRLTADGYAVRGLDLSDLATRFYADLGGELIVGDLSTGDALARAADERAQVPA